MFNKLKLKSYLISMFTAIILMSAVITAVGTFGLIQLRSNMNALVDEELAADSAVKMCRIYANVAARDLREMLITDSAEEEKTLKDNIESSLSEIEGQIEIFKKAHGEEDGLAARYETAFNEWIEIANRALDAIEAGQEDRARTIIIEECSPALSAMVDIVKDIDATTNESTEALEHKMENMNRIFIIIILAVFVVAAIVSIVLALQVTKNITGITAKIVGAVDELSKGNLKSRMEYDGANEFGELAEKINFSFAELDRYVNTIGYGMSEFSKGNFTCDSPIRFLGDFENIQRSMEEFQSKMNDTLVDLEVASAQVSAGSSQVADGAQALAQGATEQASSVEELSATIADISEHIANTAEFSQKANDLGIQTGIVVEKSKEEMAHMISAIRDIATASESIQKIIKAIDDIAFQTNILALNAAVEAARAGNAGKGFAVVADEVRNLAQKSAEAAKNTTELIENSLDHVAKGEKLAESTGEAFNEVAKCSEDILAMVAKIADASKEQALSISQISQGVDQISSVVQMNSATSEESAAASEELSGQAVFMKSLIDQFQLKEKDGSTAVYREPEKAAPHTEAAVSADPVNTSYDKY